MKLGTNNSLSFVETIVASFELTSKTLSNSVYISSVFPVWIVTVSIIGLSSSGYINTIVDIFVKTQSISSFFIHLEMYVDDCGLMVRPHFFDPLCGS